MYVKMGKRSLFPKRKFKFVKVSQIMAIWLDGPGKQEISFFEIAPERSKENF